MTTAITRLVVTSRGGSGHFSAAMCYALAGQGLIDSVLLTADRDHPPHHIGDCRWEEIIDQQYLYFAGVNIGRLGTDAWDQAMRTGRPWLGRLLILGQRVNDWLFARRFTRLFSQRLQYYQQLEQVCITTPVGLYGLIQCIARHNQQHPSRPLSSQIWLTDYPSKHNAFMAGIRRLSPKLLDLAQVVVHTPMPRLAPAETVEQRLAQFWPKLSSQQLRITDGPLRAAFFAPLKTAADRLALAATKTQQQALSHVLPKDVIALGSANQIQLQFKDTDRFEMILLGSQPPTQGILALLKARRQWWARQPDRTLARRFIFCCCANNQVLYDQVIADLSQQADDALLIIPVAGQFGANGDQAIAHMMAISQVFFWRFGGQSAVELVKMAGKAQQVPITVYAYQEARFGIPWEADNRRCAAYHCRLDDIPLINGKNAYSVMVQHES